MLGKVFNNNICISSEKIGRGEEKRGRGKKKDGDEEGGKGGEGKKKGRGEEKREEGKKIDAWGSEENIFKGAGEVTMTMVCLDRGD